MLTNLRALWIDQKCFVGLKTNHITLFISGNILITNYKINPSIFLFMKTVYAAAKIGHNDATRENGESKLCLYRGIWISRALYFSNLLRTGTKNSFPCPQSSVVILPPISREFELPSFRNFKFSEPRKELRGEMVRSLVGFTARVAWKMKSFDQTSLYFQPKQYSLREANTIFGALVVESWLVLCSWYHLIHDTASTFKTYCAEAET